MCARFCKVSVGKPYGESSRAMAGWRAVLRLKIRNQVAEPDESQNLLGELDRRRRRLWLSVGWFGIGWLIVDPYFNRKIDAVAAAVSPGAPSKEDVAEIEQEPEYDVQGHWRTGGFSAGSHLAWPPVTLIRRTRRNPAASQHLSRGQINAG